MSTQTNPVADYICFFRWSPSSRLMYCSLLPWLPALVSTCCNLTVVGWRLLAHFHEAIRWDTNELSQDTVDNTRVLDSDTLPPHVNQPAAVSFPHAVEWVLFCALRLCFWEEWTKSIEGSNTNRLSNCFAFLLFYSAKPAFNCQLSIKSSEVSDQIVNSSLLTWNVSVSDSMEDILLIPVEWALALLRWLRLCSLVLSSNLPQTQTQRGERKIEGK